MAIKPRVLFLCSENSCRTQMAEGFLLNMTGGEFEIVSAGAEAGRLDPDAVVAMREVGIEYFVLTNQSGRSVPARKISLRYHAVR